MNYTGDDDYIDWAPKRRIPLPSADVDQYMIVPIRDFERLRKLIDEELSPRRDNLPAAYFALFGAAVTAGVGVPPLMTANGLPTWIIPTFIVSACAFFVLGLILLLVDHTVGEGRKSRAAKIAKEAREIEETYRGKRPAA
jgi:hypothetical protein